MEFQTKQIKTTKTARYVTYGQLTNKTKYFWFCLHGSKMVCEQMIKKFGDFDPETHFVVAPEGLSRFYLKGFGGDVVATWMTSRDRLDEISDFSAYLTALYNQYVSKLNPECKKMVLGFSQGGTTAYRWLHNTEISLDALVCYSGWIPEDINLKTSKTPLAKLQQVYTYGLQDQFLNEERINMLKAVIVKNDLEISMERYDGDHRVDKEQLKLLFGKYVEN